MRAGKTHSQMLDQPSAGEESCTGGRYVGKETDRKWEESDDISVPEFKATEYEKILLVCVCCLTRAPFSLIADEIRAIGVRKTMELTKMSQHTIEKLIRGEAVKRKTHEHVLKAIQGLQIDDQNGR